MKIEITANLSPKAIKKIAKECAKILEGNTIEIAQIKTPKTYSTKQVAAITHKSKATIQRHCEKGILEANKPGKSWIITDENLKNYISKN